MRGPRSICWGLLFMALHAVPGWSQETFWKRLDGPRGGSFAPLAFGPHKEILAGTYHGIYQSTDDGLTWTLYAPSPAPLAWMSVFVVTPKGTLLVRFGDAIYRSTDRGANWMSIQAFAGPAAPRCLHVTVGGTIFAGSFGYGVSRSTDDGVTWTSVNDGLPFPWIRAITSTSKGTIFVTADQGLYRSTNGGTSWSSLRIPGIDRPSPSHLLVTSKDEIFVTNSPILRSTDEGVNWSPVGGPFPAFALKQLEITESGTIFVITVNDGLFRSTDGGNSYQPVALNPAVPYIEGSITTTYGSILMSSDNGLLFRSTNNGSTWSLIPTLPNSTVRPLRASPTGSLFGSLGSILAVSRDEGSTWDFSHQPTSANALARVAFDTNATAFVAAGSDLFVTQTDGYSWSKIPQKPEVSTKQVLTLDRKNRLVAGTFSGLFRSTDEGTSWAQLTLTPTLSVIAVGDSLLIVGSLRDGILRSTNDGASWTSAWNMRDHLVEMLVKDQTESIYAFTDSILFRSTDKGFMWEPISPAIPGLYFTDMATTSDDKIVFSSNKGVFASSDHGDTWNSLNEGLDYTNVVSVSTSPQGYLYCGVMYYGAYKSTHPFSPPVPIKEVAPGDTTLPDSLVYQLPESLHLHQNYPNPFRSSTVLRVSVKELTQATLSVYDILGRKIDVLRDRIFVPGEHIVHWNSGDRPTGIYFYKLESAGHTSTMKMILLK